MEGEPETLGVNFKSFSSVHIFSLGLSSHVSLKISTGQNQLGTYHVTSFEWIIDNVLQAFIKNISCTKI